MPCFLLYSLQKIGVVQTMGACREVVQSLIDEYKAAGVQLVANA